MMWYINIYTTSYICRHIYICYSKTLDEHLVKLDLTAIRQAGLRLRIKKCNFGMTTFRVLGHVVDHFGLYPNPDQVAAVKDFLQPI